MVQRCVADETRAQDTEISSQEIRKLILRLQEKHGKEVVDYLGPDDCDHASSWTMSDRLGLWTVSDIFMSTALCEGLTLMPSEYLFVRRDDPGVVILSLFSAASKALNGAIRVNPWNVAEVVEKLDLALRMSPSEKQDRAKRDHKFIMSTCSADWSRDVIATLFEKSQQKDYVNMEIAQTEIHSHRLRGDFSMLDASLAASSYASAKGQRLFLLDFGGTLVNRESEGMYTKHDFFGTSRRRPSPAVMDALGKLASDPQNTVIVVRCVSFGPKDLE